MLIDFTVTPIEENAFGFVRIEDMEKLWNDFKAQYPEIEPIDVSLGETPVLRADYYLNEKGIYLSPDLLKTVWDGFDTLLAALSVLTILWLIADFGVFIKIFALRSKNNHN